MPQNLPVFLIIFAAVLLQTYIGFGSAILAISLLPNFIPLAAATPFFTAIALLMEIVLLVVFRQSLNLRAVGRITAAAVLGVPIGILLLIRVPERASLALLGAIILAYAIYSLLNMRPPRFRCRAWDYGLGLLAGAMGGAYAITGPPVILLGHAKGWQPEAFKANLQAFFLVASLAILAGHAVSGSFTPEVWGYIWGSLPALALGLLAGLLLTRRARPRTLNVSVLWGMAALGISLIL